MGAHPVAADRSARSARSSSACSSSDWLGLDPLYGLLLTFGLALVFQGLFQNYFGASGLPYAIPKQLSGAYNLGFMFLPVYRGWVIVASMVVCFGTWLVIEKTKLGAYLRAGDGECRPWCAPSASTCRAWSR